MKVKRLLSLVLALIMLLAMVPIMPIEADAITVNQVKAQITNTYRDACSKAGVSTFNGYCAWFVNWELVLLGINASYIGGNGNDEYDNYKDMKKTSGGYDVTAYPASSYSILSALNEITNNGSRDVTNILVGFQKGMGSEGAKYGHVAFIHAILGGTVYYSESYSATVGGTNYPEGSVITCSMSTFASYYDARMTFEGIIHFQNCTHTYEGAGVCSKCGYKFPIIINTAESGTYKVLKDFTPRADRPYDSAESAKTTIAAGTYIEVLGSVVNAYDNKWYKFTYESGKIGYVYHDRLQFEGYGAQEISCTITSPTEGATVPRRAYPLKGTVTSKYPLKKVEAYIDGEWFATVNLGGQYTLDLQSSIINTKLDFAALEPGSHSLVIKAHDIHRNSLELITRRNFVTEGGQTDTTEHVTLTFESGGYCDTTSLTIEKGAEIGVYPMAVCSGHIFLGWFTSHGGRVYEYTTFDSDETLYAYWTDQYANLGDDFYAYMGHVASEHGIVVNGDNVELGTRYSADALWRFERQTDGSYVITNASDNRVLDVANGDVADYTNVWPYEYNGSLAQRWYICQTDGGYKLYSAGSDKVLDIYYGGTAIGDNVQIYSPNGSIAQVTYIEYPYLSVDLTPMTIQKGVGRTITIGIENTHHTNWMPAARDTAGIIDFTWVGSENNQHELLITPLATGETEIEIFLYDSVEGSRVDYEKIIVTVTDNYVVSFNYLDGSGVKESMATDAEGKIIIPETIPFELGYTFTGWSDVAFGSAHWGPGDALYPQGDMTLYAAYNEPETLAAPLSLTIAWAQPIYAGGYYWFEFTPSVSTSYEFRGLEQSVDSYVAVYDDQGNQLTWDDDSGDGRAFRDAYYLEAGSTYYIGLLMWTKPVANFQFIVDRGFKVTYNANGGAGAPGLTYVYCGAGGTLSDTVPSREGYQFVGWATASGAKEATYKAGEYVNIDKDTTLYAVWKAKVSAPEKPYKITNVVSGVHVYWKAVPGITKYGLWRSETGKNGEYKWIANPTVPHFTDTKVETGKTYYYKVTTMNSSGAHSEKSEAIGVTYVATPDITSRFNKAAGITLGWNKIEGATGYAIYRKSYDGTDAWVRVATISGNSTFTWQDTEVKNENGKVYRYTVRALVAGSTLSGCRNTGRTMARLTSRTLNSAVKASATSIKCSWTTSSAVTGYEVRFMVGDTVYKTFTVGNYKTGVKTFTGLEPGQTYKIQVRSYVKIDGMGFYSAWSTAKTVTLK